MSNGLNEPLVLELATSQATLGLVGGKGASLARMAAAGLPVPPGFHVSTAAYRRFVAEHGLQPRILAAIAGADTDRPATLEAAERQIASLFAAHPISGGLADPIRAAYAALGPGDSAVAVRSSATAEDLPGMSFAGQQESFLNIRGADAVLEAIRRCWASLWTARAIGYRARHGIAPADVALAVVVQELAPADAAGIMFTANPLTGARDQLLINAAWGLGESVVGGQVTPDTIVIDRRSGAVVERQISTKEVMTVRDATGTRAAPVPPDRQAAPALAPEQAAALARLGEQVERLYGQPMDIEWAARGAEIAIVQARPITALPDQNPPAEIWNDSLAGDYLWTSGNVGEAVPDVMTPCTWSLLKIFIADTMPVPDMGQHRLIGNIGGRFYMNLSVLATLAAAFGFSRQRFAEANEQTFGRLPAGVEIPLVPVSRWQVLRTMLPVALRYRRQNAANQRRLPAFVAASPARCAELRARIQAAPGAAELLAIWRAELLPYFRECSAMLSAGARQDGTAIVWVRRTLSRLVGEADTNALLSSLSDAGGHLASLGLLVGLDQLARGQIDQAAFAQQYGHRGPHEFEVSIARPAEDPGWIDRELAGLRAAPADVPAMLARQQAVQAAAWARFQRRYPNKIASMRRKIGQAAAAFRAREAARSEVIRSFWALRTFAQRAGEIAGLGEAIFFLSIDEIVALLGGGRSAVAAIPPRRAAHARYSALPPYPALIRGHFDPFAWAADPHRRGDLFDAAAGAPAGDTVAGFPGAAGVVEGRVRVLASADDGEQLQAGEILVSSATNVGWTPLFPRAAAVVTDVGAPLSHAAIVARELGIPAVVGCGNATMRLHTGDRVRVDGERGTVELLERANGVA
jgi:pyruvate,water dikinase